MLLPQIVSGGVLGLPLLTLLLVTSDPLVGCRVEAFRILVVALLVVLCRHAVQSRIEVLGSRIDGIVGLLEGQGDAATIEINVDYLDEHFFARLDDGLRVLHVAVGQLGDVHEAFDAVFDGDEDTELNDLGDLALDNLTRNVGASEALPRIFLGGLEGQGDAFTIEINVEHLDGDLVADLDNLRRVVDVLPRQLGNVDQAVNTAQINECAEIDDGGHDAFANLALLELGQEGLANFGLGLFEVLATGEHHIVAVLVELEDLGLDGLANVRGQVADATHFDQGCRQEATQTDVDDETTLDSFDNGAFDNAIGFFDLLDVAPSALVLCTLLGQNQTAFLVFLGDDKSLNGVADLDDFVRINVLLDGKLTGGNDALSLVADVEQDLVVIDLDDGTFDQITITEVLDGGIDCLDEVLFGADVVDGDLGDFVIVLCH